MLLGYNTNGLPHHRLPDALALIAEEGLKSAAITLDAGALDPYTGPDRLMEDVKAVRDALDKHGLARVVETGARFLLNPKKKHDPTLMDPLPQRRAHRLHFLRSSLGIAIGLGAPALSLWSGALVETISDDEALDRLALGLKTLLAWAEPSGTVLAFEPEPGMFIDTFAKFAAIDERVNHELFQLTIDLGHVHCVEEGDLAGLLRRWGPRARNAHVEDMVKGVHEHLMFGEGTMDFPELLGALGEAARPDLGLHVELSRHGHMGPEAVRKSAAFLGPILAGQGR